MLLVEPSEPSVRARLPHRRGREPDRGRRGDRGPARRGSRAGTRPLRRRLPRGRSRDRVRRRAPKLPRRAARPRDRVGIVGRPRHHRGRARTHVARADRLLRRAPRAHGRRVVPPRDHRLPARVGVLQRPAPPQLHGHRRSRAAAHPPAAEPARARRRRRRAPRPELTRGRSPCSPIRASTTRARHSCAPPTASCSSTPTTPRWPARTVSTRRCPSTRSTSRSWGPDPAGSRRPCMRHPRVLTPSCSRASRSAGRPGRARSSATTSGSRAGSPAPSSPSGPISRRGSSARGSRTPVASWA